MADIEFGSGISNKAFPSRTEEKHAGSKSGDAILTHYLKRLDPNIAASFTEDQREALHGGLPGGDRPIAALEGLSERLPHAVLGP